MLNYKDKITMSLINNTNLLPEIKKSELKKKKTFQGK